MSQSPNASRATSNLVRQLHSIVGQLERLHPHRAFTLDGHLVGSVGEVIAAERYGLTLLSMSESCHDARTADGRLVQIKTTQGASVGLRSEPEHLLVLALNEDGSIDEVFNGPGSVVWSHVGKVQSNGQRFIGIGKLRRLMGTIGSDQRVG